MKHKLIVFRRILIGMGLGQNEMNIFLAKILKRLWLMIELWNVRVDEGG
jgi:hypothetical protein